MIFESIVTFLSKILFFTSYINGSGSFPTPLAPEEEKRQLTLLREGNAEEKVAAKDILMRHNLRLVAHIVKKYNNAAEVDDLISVGTIGLIKGINSYNDGKGTMLATYAARCIENEILMYIRANKKHRSILSLHETIGTDRDGNEIQLLEVLPDKDSQVLDTVEANILMKKMREIIRECLDPREYRIILLRYGLNGGDCLTQREVAKKLNISRSYISRIEKKALQKVRAEVKKRDIYL